MKKKKYYKSERAKMNLASHRVRRLYGNYFEPCHVTRKPVNQNDFSFCRSVYWIRGLSIDWYCFPYIMRNVQRTSFYQCLLCCLSSCSFSWSSLIFFFLMKLKSSKVLFRFAPRPLLAIILLKPRALSNAISNRTDWRYCKRGQSRWHLWHAHILLYFLKAN